MKKQQFDISIDHPMMGGAKAAFDTCLKRAITKAISTGSNEGSATLKISFEIFDAVDQISGEMKTTPVFKFKTGFSVPIKESIDATIAESSVLVPGSNGYMLVNGQISMDELIMSDGPGEE